MSQHFSADGLPGTPLLGFDEDGQVFDRGDLVLRTIRAERKAEVALLHRIYEQAGLSAKGIVGTQIRDDGDLEHAKLVVSYPFEWPANMYKDAVLFHLGLFAELDTLGLTLKDALPNNILFDGASPVFVDFLSLVRNASLREAQWLDAGDYVDARFAVANKMLLPYMVLPLLFMGRGEYRIARELLSVRSCNCDGTPPAWSELLWPNRRPGLGWLRSYCASLATAAQLLPSRWLGRWRGPQAFLALVRWLIQRVEATDVTPPVSAYASYYDEKKESLELGNPAAFLPKQKAVHEALLRRQPATVLDIGANTGWFSHLAANQGASVIALEEDESCVDILYRRAKKLGLRILPLKASFGDLTGEIHSAPGLAPARERSAGAGQPLYRAGVERLRSDAVLILGLVHHLTLGEGRSLEEVFDILSRLAKNTVVLEFVSLDDEKIRQDPAFFPNLNRFDESSYSIDLVIRAGRRHFGRVEEHRSHPPTRTILVFDR